MTRKELEKDLAVLLTDFTSRDFEGLSDTEELLPYAGLDSIGLISVVCLIEDRYGISIPEEGLFEIRTLSDLTDVVYSQLV